MQHPAANNCITRRRQSITIHGGVAEARVSDSNEQRQNRRVVPVGRELGVRKIAQDWTRMEDKSISSKIPAKPSNVQTRAAKVNKVLNFNGPGFLTLIHISSH